MEQIQKTEKNKREDSACTEAPKVSLVFSVIGEVTEEEAEGLPFDTAKPSRLARALVKNHIVPEAALEQPEEISRTALERVHDSDYLAVLRHPLFQLSAMPPLLPSTAGEFAVLKMPAIFSWWILRPIARAWAWIIDKRAEISPFKVFSVQDVDEMIRGAEVDAGGTLLAARRAMETGIGINIGGAAIFAHPAICNAGHLFADIPVTIRALQTEKLIERAFVLDLCAYFPSGTAHCLASNEKAFIFSMHQKGLWPDLPDNPHPSDLDLELEEGTSDQEYMEILTRHLPSLLDEHQPELLFLVTGNSVLSGDATASLSLSADGLVKRDAYVAEACMERNIPLVITISDGLFARSKHDGAFQSVRNLIETYGGAWAKEK
jgi:acetoin utilization deacetylase AcuC-like enzyme